MRCKWREEKGRGKEIEREREIELIVDTSAGNGSLDRYRHSLSEGFWQWLMQLAIFIHTYPRERECSSLLTGRDSSESLERRGRCGER
jgi:hypothetical protein